MNFFDIEPAKPKPPVSLDDIYREAGFKKGKHLDESHDRSRLISIVCNKVVRPRIEKSKKKNWLIELTSQETEYLSDFADRKVRAKDKENGSRDSYNRQTRELTGAKAEYASLKYYGVEEFFDDSITNQSFTKNHPDFKDAGVVLGTKSSTPGLVPMVYKSTRAYIHNGFRYKCCDMITVVENNTIYLLGIATPSIMEIYADSNLIRFADAPTKAGFWGMEHLIDLPKSLDELKTLCKENIVPVK